MAKCCFKLNEKLFDFGGGGCEGYEEVANYAALPATGETDIIYKTLDDGNIYEWNGSAYVELVEQSTPIGATLMKTGQTTSYRTGDDGDLEAGRATDFFTLESNNPFGNNKRFTGITGGYQTGGVYYNKDGGTTTSALSFPSDIVIDWSTTECDGTSVLGYKRTLEANAIWNSHIDNCLALTTGGFSGWFLVNYRQAFNLIQFETPSINYNPFNLTGFFFTGTSKNSTNAYYILASDGSSGPYAKASPLGAMAARVFTVTGTILT